MFSALRWLAGGLVVTAALTGCTGSGSSAATSPVAAASAAPAPSSATAVPSGAPAAPSPDPPGAPDGTPRPDEAQGRPHADPASPPAATSGPLQTRTLPAPAAIGPGWAYRVDPGSAEDGYVTSGQPSTARDPQEVAVALVPFDCPDLTAVPELPVPRRALEVTYVDRRRDAPGVGLALGMRTPAEASAFLQAYVDAQAACSSGRARVADATAVEVLSRDATGALLRRRDSPAAGGAVWVEAVAQHGARVLLLAVAEARPGAVDPARVARALTATRS